MNLFYETFLVLVPIISIFYFLGCSLFSAWLAYQKGYSGASWFFLGLFFGVFALITIGFAPIKIPQVKKEEQVADTIKNQAEFESGAKFKIIKEVALQPKPDLNSGIVTWLKLDEKVICLETTVNKNEEWMRVRTARSEEGWCGRDAISEAGE